MSLWLCVWPKVLKAPPEEAVCSALNVDFARFVAEKPQSAKLNNERRILPRSGYTGRDELLLIRW
jgi:hypothetical protein